MATYVLVHGAYQGGWIWKLVAERLRAAGHLVYAPTLDGCAERHHHVRAGINIASHAKEVADFLFYEDLRKVVLVGTSSGGMVISKAADEARDRIGRLVFVDALALYPGEEVSKIVKRAASPEITHLTIGPTRADVEQRLFADLAPELRAWAWSATAASTAALERRCRRPRSGTIVAGHRSAAPRANPPEAHQRRTAERLRATWHEVDTGHYPMLSEPAELARLLLAEAGRDG
jgi:pimeloyl-ACP methyl ester carboxylesterase